MDIANRTYKLRFEDPERFNEFVNQIRVCNKVRGRKGWRRYILIFVKKDMTSGEKFNNYIQMLRDALGGGASLLVTWMVLDKFLVPHLQLIFHILPDDPLNLLLSKHM
ncbi:MAG: hypothetical protein JTT15_02655 [Candidatus Brockarchaeota archaeon]|nr:hypothetical protein [Candidatus Brockarchaeota archaeon]